MLSLFPRDVLDEIWDLIESVSEGFPTHFCFYNTKNPTYLHQATGTYTSLDLSICLPTLLTDYGRKVHDDLCGIDGFPILVNNIGPDIGEPLSRWKLNKANWTQFQTLCTTRLLEDTVQKDDDPTESFAFILINMVEETVRKTSMRAKKTKSLGLQMIVKLVLNTEKEHFDNSISSIARKFK